jgi:hypothetical protein
MGISAKEMSQRLSRIANESALKILVNAEIAENEERLISIKKDEYEQGDIYSNGVRRTYAWKAYREEKQLLNPRADGFVDLIFSGSFINSFLIEETPKKDKLIFKSTDSKYKLLGDKYNNSVSNIYNLDQEVFDNFLDKYVKKDFIKAIKKELGQ